MVAGMDTAVTTPTDPLVEFRAWLDERVTDAGMIATASGWRQSPSDRFWVLAEVRESLNRICPSTDEERPS